MSIKKFLIIVTFLLFFNPVTAQSVIHGYAYDGTGNILPDSEINLSDSHQVLTTHADNEGRFEFKNVPKGSYTIALSAGNYTESKTIIVKEKDIEIILYLEEMNSDQVLDDMVIQVESVKSKLEKEGFAVNVIETQKYALQSIQTNELLDRAAGVRIRQDGGLGSHIHYNINGMTGNAVKIFIDGVPATNFGQSFSLNSIPPALIERIEVYKGVIPGYLSEDALGGAINIVMKQNKKSFLTTSYSLGSFNTHQFNASGSYRNDKGFILDASTFYNYSDNNYEVWGEDITFRDYQGRLTRNHKTRRFHDTYRSYGTKVDFGWRDVKWADRFTIGGVTSDDYKEIQNGITMQRVFGDRHSRRNSNVLTLNYAKRDLFTKGLSARIDASYSALKTQVFDTVGIMYDWRGPILYPDGTPVRYSSGAELGNRKTSELNKDKSLVVRANFGYEINDNNKFYANYLFNNFDREVEDDYLPLGLQLLQNTRDLQKNIVTLTYENLSFNDRLRTNIFYKYYHQKVTSNMPYQISSNPAEYGMDIAEKNMEHDGYGITFSYELFPNIQVLGSAERAIRFPNAREIFGNAADNLNPGDVDPEESFNSNIGLIMGTYTFGKHSLRINTSVFYRDTKGMIREAITSGNSGTSYYENLEDVMTKGIDAEIIYNYSDKVNFTFNISKFDVLFNTEFDQYGAPYLFYRHQIRNEPSFKFNGNLVYYHNDLFQKNSHASINYNVSYVNGFLRNWANVGLNNLDEIPMQFSNDIGMMYSFPNRKVTVSFDAKNIFNRQLFDNFGLQKPGRAFFGKITYNIL